MPQTPTQPSSPSPSGLWSPRGLLILTLLVAVTVVGGRFALEAMASETTPERPDAIWMGADLNPVEAYVARFNDPQAMAGPDVENWNGEGWLFVANEVGRGVSVYDIRTQQPVAWIYSPRAPVPHHPYLSPDQRWVVADARFGSESIVIDTENDFATTYLEFPEGEDGEVAGPLHGIYTSDSRYFLVALQRSGRVGVIDLKAEDGPKVAEVIDVGTRPRDIQVTPDDEKAFVTMQRENRVAVIDIGTWDVRYIQRSETDYSDGSGGGGGMSEDGSLMAVSNTLDDEVVIIDTATEQVVHRIGDVPSPVNAEFLGDTHTVGTGNRSDGSVTFIDADAGTLEKTVETGGGANIPYLGPDGNFWLTHNGDHQVSVLHPETYEILHQIETDVNPHWVHFTPNNARAFVTNWGSKTVSVIDTEEYVELGRIDTALNPNGMAMKTDVTREQASRALERAQENGVAEDIAKASEMVLPEPRDEQEKVFLNTCTQCHDLGRIVRNNAKTKEQWTAIVERMKGNGAELTPESTETIIDYLSNGRQSDLEFGTRYDEEYQATHGGE